MAQHDGKIFGIGFYKTGTTTLYDALRVLGYHTINGDKLGSYPGADDGATFIRQIDAGDYRLPTFEMYDAFTDNPYFRIWREIYALYPDAHYILTVRDEDAWIASCVKFFRHRRIRPMRVWMFGPHANPARGWGSAVPPRKRRRACAAAPDQARAPPRAACGCKDARRCASPRRAGRFPRSPRDTSPRFDAPRAPPPPCRG
jgi:hypothetical protein